MLSYLVALNCEARAIIEHYSLKKTGQGPFAHYISAGQANAVELVVSGIGAIAMATAVGWLAAHRPAKDRVWLNLGVAGHASLALGQPVLVHGSAQAIEGRAHYPPLVAKWPGATAACLSHSAPNTDYIGDALADMEAHAFFAAAGRFSSAELVQSIKVVSDNSAADMAKLNAQKIEELLSPHTPLIARFGESLSALMPKAEAQDPICAQLLKLRTTHSQQRLIQELVEKAIVLQCLSEPLRVQLLEADEAKQVIELLSEATASVCPQIPLREVG